MYKFQDFLDVFELHPVLAEQAVSVVGSEELESEILRSEAFKNRFKRRALTAAGVSPEAFDELPEETRSILYFLAKEPMRAARLCGLVSHPRLIQHSINPKYASVLSGTVSKEDFWAAADLAGQQTESGAIESSDANYSPDTALELIELSGTRCIDSWSSAAGNIEKSVVMALFPSVAPGLQEPSGDTLNDQLVTWFAIDQIKNRNRSAQRAA